MKIEEALVYFRTGHRIRLQYPYINENLGFMRLQEILDPKARNSFIITDLGFLSNEWEVEFVIGHGHVTEWSKGKPGVAFIDKGYTTSKFTEIPKTGSCETWGSFDWRVTGKLDPKPSDSSLGLDPM